MRIFDCTLRDGGNVFGKGFAAEDTVMMLEGLIEARIEDIEYGHCTGIGSTKADGSNKAPLTDIEYLELAQPYVNQANLGMFVGWKNATPENVKLAKKYGLKFLRVGINAGDGAEGIAGIRAVKKEGLSCKAALMKAYVLSPQDLAEEAKKYEEAGLDHAIIMDSAGTMLPAQVGQYVKTLKKTLTIPVGFHGHNNLGLASANALAALEAGADTIDGGLLGMARSAGNIATELVMALLEQAGTNPYDFYALMRFLDSRLVPRIQEEGYQHFNKPLDIILGLAGAHSSFTPLFQKVAKEEKVDFYRLIVQVSKENRKNPSEDFMRQIAKTLE